MKDTFYKKHIKPIVTKILICFAVGATLYGNFGKLFEESNTAYDEFMDGMPDDRDEYENVRYR